MNRSELRNLVANLCEDPNQTKFTAVKYNDTLELAQRQFSIDSKSLFKDQSITMAAGTGAYALGSDFLWEKLVTLNGEELDPISRNTLQAKRKGGKWADDTGTPAWYVIDPEEAKKSITLYPIPDSAAAGTDLVVSYYALPAAMSTDASVPLNNSTLLVGYHEGIAYKAADTMLGYLQQTPEIQAKRNDLQGRYVGKVNEAIQQFGTTKTEPLSFHVRSVRAR
jgi:hypothetical protein